MVTKENPFKVLNSGRCLEEECLPPTRVKYFNSKGLPSYLELKNEKIFNSKV